MTLNKHQELSKRTIGTLTMPSAQPEQQHGRVFKGIVVEYPSYNTYPEYKGKPYFLIKYTENGQEFIGYGTYKPEVLSEFLKEYFMPSAQAEERTEECTEMHACDCINRQAAIDAIGTWDKFGVDERCRIVRWHEGLEPYVHLRDVLTAIVNLPTAQPEQRWIPCKERMPTKDGAYLVSGRWASGKESVGDCDYSKEDGYFHTAWNFDVLAWRELPEPYGGGQNGD